MMRIRRTLFTFGLIIFAQVAFSQKKMQGYYRGFPEVLILHEDSTFFYRYAYDLFSSWSSGVWYTDHDTLNLKVIPVFDTLYTPDSLDKEFELILSFNEISEKITYSNYVETKNHLHGQNRRNPVQRLLIKRKRLFYISSEEKVQKIKWFDPISQKKRKTCFKKIKTVE